MNSDANAGMQIALIVAISEDGTIGDKGKIPWHISDDLKRFKKLTMSHAVIMGRKTYESIGRPLPGRTNIVLTRNRDFVAPASVQMFASFDAALNHCRRERQPLVFVIGGREVYREALPHADKLFVTEVHQRVMGDTKFPDYDRCRWTETGREDRPEYSFVEYTRLGKADGQL